VSAVPVKERAAVASQEPDADDVFDPLGAFLQDLDSPVGGDGKSGNTPAKPIEESSVNLFDDADDDDDDDIDDLDLDDFDDPLLEDPLLDDLEQDALLAVEEESEAVHEEPQREETERPEPQEKQAYFADPLEEELQIEVRREVPKPTQAAPRQEPPQREVPRQPESKRPQNRDLQSPTERAAKPPQSVTAGRSSPGGIRPRVGGLPQRTEAASPTPRVVEAREKPVRAESIAPPLQHKPVAPQKPAVQHGASQMRVKPEGAPPTAQSRPTADVVEGAGSRTGKAKQGRLFGWLVSYENPDGRAIELRAGRFFVTGTSIRPTDLILEDQSISTPHALMAITENGFQVQDLMSERGTFIRCQGEAQYTREDGVVEVRHGDWIRFGDVEFLVTVVPS